ncbi:MAG: DUF4194 domain-containing protein [Gracilibacteraceae bacterium]|nr:DUF4194 domain-containing protein [Gracilibacteraceae bacterium]
MNSSETEMLFDRAPKFEPVEPGASISRSESQSESQSESEAETATNTLFVGDAGELPLDTRRVLVQLLMGPFLDKKRHPILWPILIQNQSVVRRRLADLFLELILDLDIQVAFTRQADTGDLEVPRLLRRAPLTFIDSVLLLYLRQFLMQAESHSERAVVSAEEISEHLYMFDRVGNTDHAGFEKRVKASIEKFKERNILHKLRSSDNRFEISPTLKLLFSADQIQALTSAYQQLQP